MSSNILSKTLVSITFIALAWGFYFFSFWNNLPLDIQVFIQDVREDITLISIDRLEKGLNRALSEGSCIMKSEDKTTLFSVAERVSQIYKQSNLLDKALAVRLKTAQAISPGKPLVDLPTKLTNEHPILGLKLYPVGTSGLKNHTLGVQARKFTDGSRQFHFSAKLNHFKREEMQALLDYIKNNPEKLYDALPEQFCKSVKLWIEQTTYKERTDGIRKWEGDFSLDNQKAVQEISELFNICESQVICFEGVGVFKVGNSPEFISEYNRITLDLDPEISPVDAVQKIHIIFAALGIGTVSSSSRCEDIERIKTLQLFRGFYPRESYLLERDSNTFEESVVALQDRIIRQVREMKELFKHYFIDHPGEVYSQNVYPDQSVWAIKGISDQVRRVGGIGLMAGLVGKDITDIKDRLISTLKYGAMSTQDRFELGIITEGQKSMCDLKAGGGESVFLRLITKSMPKNLDHYPYAGDVQILYDLDLLERVGYAYSCNSFGTKNSILYKKRLNIIDLTKKIEKSICNFQENEICIGHRIGPEFIRGIRLNNSFVHCKDQIMEVFKKEGLVIKNSLNQDCFHGKPIDEFIRLGDVKAEYWD